MVQNTNAGQQLALLKAELDKAQGAAATNLDGWQRTYAELQRSESDAAAFVQTIQQLRAELEQARSDMLGMRSRIQSLEAELATLRKHAESAGDPKATAELLKLSAEHAALKERAAALQKDLDGIKSTVNAAPVGAAANGAAAGQDANAAASPDLQAELDKAKAEATVNLDGWQRTRAEFANYKKRMEANSAEMQKFAASGLVAKLFPVQDDFERAIKNMPASLKGDVWADGVQLISRKIGLIFEAEGVKPMEVKKNDVFDPSIHEAVTHDEDPEVTSGHIIEELQKGYKIGERVVRPTLVRVAR